VGVAVDVGQRDRGRVDVEFGQLVQHFEGCTAVFEVHHDRGAGPVSTGRRRGQNAAFEVGDPPVVDTGLDHAGPDRVTVGGARDAAAVGQVADRHPVGNVPAEQVGQLIFVQIEQPVTGRVVVVAVSAGAGDHHQSGLGADPGHGLGT